MDYQKIYPEAASVSLVKGMLSLRGIIPCTKDVDENGTDLILILEIEDNAKIGRLQVKARTLSLLSNRTSIHIPKKYVYGTFCTILQIIPTNSIEIPLDFYCFFEEDIKQWKRTKNHEYLLSLNYSTYKKYLEPFKINDHKIDEIKNRITRSEPKKELAEITSFQYHKSTNNNMITSGAPVFENNEVAIFQGGAAHPYGLKYHRSSGTYSSIYVPEHPERYNFNPSSDTFSIKLD